MTIRATLYQARGEDLTVDLGDGGPVEIKDHQLLWIDMDDRDLADLGRAAHAVGLEDAALRRLQRTDRRARILRLPERVVLTIGAVEPDDDDARRRELDIVVGENHVITVHDGPLSAVAGYGKDLAEEREIGRLDAASFTAGVLDAVFAAYFRQIELIERDIDALDEIAVRTGGDDSFLDTVLAIRRRIARLRRALAPNREALLPLARPDFELRADLGPVWPGIVERLERAIDSVENARELLIGSFDLYLGRSSQRTNDVMKALTLISAIFLPGIILAGVMGMNFKLDFFDNPENFYIVVAVMLLASVAILGVARWRRWI
ncbi:MAG TPA: CorA family divalent cation transporter [Candidatus Limnocylindrales bacterium]|nr:CorA family divalent cation transporter [Candidatus Limnocylindrales bacterium]